MGLRVRRQKLLLLRHKYDVGRNEDPKYEELSCGLDFIVARGYDGGGAVGKLCDEFVLVCSVAARFIPFDSMN